MEQQKKEKKKVVMPYGLRNKLMAAVAMLLVSSIMMVSSTFAWFTLSTAPEIKGISTSVGANGNLEMALLTSGADEASNTFADLTKITSAAGDSTKDPNVKNLTWGNLVDLGYTATGAAGNYYGLDKIQLMPARLNTNNDGTALKVVSNPLLTPKYGTDGRVGDVNGQTFSSAKYTAGGFEYSTEANSATYGVRAVGESATLTPQEKGLMNAKADYTTNLNKARSTVQASLKTNMQGLANAALALVNNSNASFESNSDEAKAITALLNDMSTALDQIDKAYGDVVRAMVASQVTDAKTYEAVMSVLGGAKYSDMVGENGNLKVPDGKNLDTGVTLPTVSLTSTPVAVAAATLATQKQAVTDAQAAINNTENPNYNTAVKKLANTDYMDINGLRLKRPTNDNEVEGSVWMKDNDGYKVDQNALAGSVLTQGVTINMADDSGLFAYIAKVSTNYSASDSISMVFAGLKVEKKADGTGGVLVTMKTTLEASEFDQTVTNEITDLTAANATGVTNYITDTYGYIIDMAFRTNASGSYLKLATDGMQRIYNGDDASTNTETMGAGSTMTFTSVKDSENKDVMNETAIVNLMYAIRVVFFDPGDGTTGNGGRIYGIASLDNVQKSDAGMTGKLTLKTADFANGVMTLTAKPAVGEGANENDKLMDLTQNTAARMSVLVYLDGDMVDNSMVANAAQSITGSLNLQFASSADLKPMQNSALKNGTTTNP